MVHPTNLSENAWLDSTANKTPNYATFQSAYTTDFSGEPISRNDDCPSNRRFIINNVLQNICTCFHCVRDRYPIKAGALHRRPNNNNYRVIVWNIITGAVVCIAFLVFHRPVHLFDAQDPSAIVIGTPEWHWDHNFYSASFGSHHRHNDRSSQNTSCSDDDNNSNAARNLLIVQTTGSRQLEDLAAITSHVNRAYARQWRVDYARLSTHATSLGRACLEKAYALQELLRMQNTDSHAMNPHVGYDTVVILPPDAILADLDYDVLQLVPSDKLVAVAGWQVLGSTDNIARVDSQGLTETILFNLRHKNATDVAFSWWDMAQSQKLTCGAGNELELLWYAIESVNDESLASLVFMLNESKKGFIGSLDDDRVIKEIVSGVPTAKALMLASNMVEARVAVQTTVDSVCYRFYPRCELL